MGAKMHLNGGLVKGMNADFEIAEEWLVDVKEEE